MLNDINNKNTKFGLTLVFNDEIRASKPKSQRDDWDNMLTHRNGKALGAVVVENRISAKKTDSWVTFYKDGNEIDNAETFDVIDIIDSYYYVEGNKNIYIIKEVEAVNLGFFHQSVMQLIADTFKPNNTLERDLTEWEEDNL